MVLNNKCWLTNAGWTYPETSILVDLRMKVNFMDLKPHLQLHFLGVVGGGVGGDDGRGIEGYYCLIYQVNV